MGSCEEETGYQCDKVELKAYESKEDKQKEAINTISTEELTPIDCPVIWEERRKVDQERQDKFHDNLLNKVPENPPEKLYPQVKLMEFLQTKPLSFATAAEPMDAEHWLMDTSRKLKSVGCKDEQKVRYATYLLTGSAATWWEELKFKSFGGGDITWTNFKQKFHEAYVVGNITKKNDGEALEQENLPVLKHVREFNRLSRYVTEEVDLEAIRQKRFMKKIQTTLKMQLRIVRAKEFQELLDSVHASDEKDNKEIYGKRKRVQVENRQVLDSQLILNSSFQHGN
jgi:hypothetical protein